MFLEGEKYEISVNLSLIAPKKQIFLKFFRIDFIKYNEPSSESYISSNKIMSASDYSYNYSPCYFSTF